MDENFKFQLWFGSSTLSPTDFEDAQYTLDVGKWGRDHV